MVASLQNLTQVEIKKISAKQAADMSSSFGEECFDLVTMELFGNNVPVI